MYKKKLQIGYRIKTARKSAGLTQTELAEKIGYMRNSIAQYELGTLIPSIKVLEKIAEKTNKTLVYFLEDKGISEIKEPFAEYSTFDQNTVNIPIYNSVVDFVCQEPCGFEGMPRMLSAGAKFAIIWNEDIKEIPLITRGDICYIKPEKEVIEGKVMFIKTREDYKIVKIEKEEIDIHNYEFVEIVGVVVRVNKEVI